MSVFYRFKQERNRLGLTQTQVAELLGKGKTTIINWEKNAGAPDAVQLFELSGHGFDINYIVTGIKSASVTYPTGGMETKNIAQQEYLSAREYALLDDFRALSDEEKNAAETMLHAVAKSKVKKA